MIAPRHPRPCFWPLLCAALLGCALAAGAEPARLTIGQGWAWVRETFPPSGEKEISRILWSQPPPQIDLDTLQVWNVRRPWPIQEWRWLEPGPPPPADPSQPLVWRPRENLPLPPARTQLEIQFNQPLPHSMGHSLTYRLPGFNWHAFYRVTVRGIGPESIDAVQVDLTAFLRIQNDTAAAYPDARISLVGVDEYLLPRQKSFGLLDLDPGTALPEGSIQADHTLTLINDLSSPVRIQATERPATPLQWDLVRSSSPCTETTSALLFDLTLQPRTTQVITYRLRMNARTKP